MSGSQQEIHELLAKLKDLIGQAVREEQQRDQLTHLPNGMALTERLEEALINSKAFWVAFIEVDRFKRINTLYGYELADGLLQAISRQLRAAQEFFPGAALAYRAHGDEFFMLGSLEPSGADIVAQGLEAARNSIRSLNIPADPKKAPMSCTVSIGWLTSADLAKLKGGVRGVYACLERAVDHAKRQGRDCVVRYSDEIRKLETINDRGTCSICEANFSVDYAADKSGDGNLYCPNCGLRHPRTRAPGQDIEPKEI